MVSSHYSLLYGLELAGQYLSDQACFGSRVIL